MKEKNQAPVSESTSFSPFPDMSEIYIGPNSSIRYGWRGWVGKWTAGRTEEKSLPPRRDGGCFQQGYVYAGLSWGTPFPPTPAKALFSGFQCYFWVG